MSTKENTPRIALPRGWNENVKSAMLHVISLAQLGMAYTHGWAANSINSVGGGQEAYHSAGAGRR